MAGACAPPARTDRTPETTLRDIAVLLMAGMFAPVAELSLVLPGHRAVRGARRRRAGLGHDAGRAPALQAARSCPTTTSPGKRWRCRAVRDRRGVHVAARDASSRRIQEPPDGRADDRTLRQPGAVDPRRYFEAGARPDRGVADKPPVCLYLEMTNRCNLLCTTCPRTYAELEPPADMSWELFTRIVDQVPEHRARRAARRRRADAGEGPAAHGALPEGPRRLRAVQHQRHRAERRGTAAR